MLTSPYLQSSIPLLQRDTSISRVLDEQTAVDLAFVEPGLLVAGVDDVGGTGGFLEDTDLVLPSAAVIVGHGTGDGLERIVALGVVDLQGAVEVS
jgi:hypothetical protein